MADIGLERDVPQRRASQRQAPAPRRVEPPLVLESRQMFGGRREVLIAHGDEVYRLRLTAADRLILTK